MFELAQSMPGFISFKSFNSDDGERVSIIEFQSLDSLQAWRDHPEHKKAQQLGCDWYYTEYEYDSSERHYIIPNLLPIEL